MDGFKNSTKTKYSSGDSELIGAAARKVDPKGSVVVGSVKPLYRDRELIGKAARKVDPKGSVMAGDAARYCNGGAVKQPVQKKSLGGVLKSMSPAAMLADSKVGKDLMGAGVFGLGGLALNALMKKKQSGQPLTPAEDKQLAQAPQATMKKGGMAKKSVMAKKGVPVAPKGPMVGLAAMPKKK